MKKCNNPNCELENKFQSLENFNKNKNNKDGLSNRCKKCVKKSVKSSYLKNKEYYCKTETERYKNWKIHNPEKYKQQSLFWNEKYKNEGYWQKYYQNNKEKITDKYKQKIVKDKRNAKWKHRYKNDIKFKLKILMQANFHLFFKDKGLNKNLSFSKIINYTYNDLIKYLEINFRLGMNWENFGILWEIHHIKPQNMFNPLNELEVKVCWDLNNLLPLWKTTEISKQMGDTIKGNRNIKKDEIYDYRVEN